MLKMFSDSSSLLVGTFYLAFGVCDNLNTINVSIKAFQSWNVNWGPLISNYVFGDAREPEDMLEQEFWGQ